MSKKYLLSPTLVALLLMFHHAPAQAQVAPAESAFPNVEVLDARYGGTGCPQGTASVAFSGSTLIMYFDDYEARTSYGDRTERATCAVALALRIPPGFTIAPRTIVARGYADIPGGGVGTLFAEYFWAGSKGPLYAHIFRSGFSGYWMDSGFLDGTEWSPCGGEVIARANTSAVVRKASPYSAYEAEVSISRLLYYFDWAPC